MITKGKEAAMLILIFTYYLSMFLKNNFRQVFIVVTYCTDSKRTKYKNYFLKATTPKMLCILLPWNKNFYFCLSFSLETTSQMITWIKNDSFANATNREN